MNVQIAPWARREGPFATAGGRDPGKVRLAPSPPSQRRFETQLETAGRPEASGRRGRSPSSPRPVTDLGRPTPAPRWGTRPAQSPRLPHSSVSASRGHTVRLW